MLKQQHPEAVNSERSYLPCLTMVDNLNFIMPYWRQVCPTFIDILMQYAFKATNPYVQAMFRVQCSKYFEQHPEDVHSKRRKERLLQLYSCSTQ